MVVQLGAACLFLALPPSCAPAQGGGHGQQALRGQVSRATSLL